MRANEFVIERVIGQFPVGDLTIYIDDHAIESTYFKEADYHAVDRAIFKLKNIQSELDTLDHGERSWVFDPESKISLGIRRLNKGNDYLLATVHPTRTFDSDVTSFTLPEGELTEQELQELTFLGSPCTKDCSGHRAGYKWYKQKGYDPQSWSPSFNNGAALARDGK